MALSGRSLKNIFSKPATTKYPDEPFVPAERTRGSVENFIDDCIFCGMCMRTCPTRAIKVERDLKAWSIDRCACIACAECVSKCPKKCLSMSGQYAAPVLERALERFEQAAEEPTAEQSGKHIAKR